MQLACNRSSPEPFELESDIRADCDVIRAEDEHREAREHMGGEVHGGGAHHEGEVLHEWQSRGTQECNQGSSVA